MSANETSGLKKSILSCRIVTSPQHETGTAGEAGVEYATEFASAWSSPVPFGSLNSQNQARQPPLLQEPLEGDERAEVSSPAVAVGESGEFAGRASEQDDPATWAPGSYSEEAPTLRSWSQNAALGSSRLLTRDGTLQQMEGYKSVPEEDAAEGQLSEAAANKGTPLFGLPLKEAASSPAQGSTPLPEEPTSLHKGGLSRTDFAKNTSSGQRGSDTAQRTGPNDVHESPLCNGQELPSGDKNLTASEEEVLPNERDMPLADGLDAYDGGNEPVGGSSRCLSLSTSSDTHSETHHILLGSSSHLQRQNLTSLRQAPIQQIADFPVYTRTSADAALSPAITEGSRCPGEGVLERRKDLEGGKKDLPVEANQNSLTYGKAKIVTDMLAGLAGMQPVAIICCFVSDSPLGGVLSMFCLFSGAFAHYDKRPASYFLCSLLAFSLATILIIALCSSVPGFENFHSVQLLRHMSIVHTVVLLLTGFVAGGLGSRAVSATMAHEERGLWGQLLKPRKGLCQRPRRQIYF